MAGNIGDLIIGIGLDLKGLSKDLNRATYKLKAQSRKWKDVGSSLSSAITLPLAAVGAAGIAMSFELEKSLQKITNLVGVSSTQLDSYKNDILNISKETGKSQAELANALFDITSAGLTGSAAIEALNKSAKASVIGLGDTAIVASALTSAMNAYEQSGLNAAKATEVLAATVRVGKTEAESLAPAIGQVLGIASQLGVSFEEVGANLATFTRIGVNSKEAATALKSLLSGFSGAAGAAAAKALDSIGLSMGDVRKSIREDGLLKTLELLYDRTNGNVEVLSAIIPNVREFSNILGTAGVQADTYAENLKAISESSTLVDDGFKKVSKSASFKFTQAINNLKNVGITIGNLLLPYVIDLAAYITNLTKKFDNLSPAFKKSILVFGLVAAAIGPILVMIGSLIGAVSTITGALGLAAGALGSFLAVASGVGLAVVAVVALGVAIKNLFFKTEELSESKKALNDISTDVSKKLGEEKTKNDRLLGVMNDVNESFETRKGAYDILKQKYPDILGNYDKEKGYLGDIAKLQNDLALATEDRVKRQVASSKTAALEAEKEKIQARLIELKYEGGQTQEERNKANKAARAGLIEGDDGEYSGVGTVMEQNNARVIKLYEQQYAAQEKAIQQVRIRYNLLTDEQQALSDASAAKIKIIETETKVELTAAEKLELAAKKKADAQSKRDQLIKDNLIFQAGSARDLQVQILEQSATLEKSILDLNNLTSGSEAYNAKLKETQKLSRELIKLKQDEAEATLKLNLAIAGRTILSAPAAIETGIKAPVSQSEGRAEIEAPTAEVEQAKEAVIELEESIKGGLIDSTILLAESFGSILSGSESFTEGIKNLGRGLLGVLSDVLQKVGKQIIQAGIAMLALKKTLNFGNPLAAVAAGVGLVAIAKIAQAKISASVPKLASGGVLTGETLFIGGEYSGASTNPEIVTPQNIMAETFRKVLGQSGGGGGVGVLHMDTIRFGLEKDNVRVN